MAGGTFFIQSDDIKPLKKTGRIEALDSRQRFCCLFPPNVAFMFEFGLCVVFCHHDIVCFSVGGTKGGRFPDIQLLNVIMTLLHLFQLLSMSSFPKLYSEIPGFVFPKKM